MKSENKQAWIDYVDNMACDRLKVYIVNLIDTENKVVVINNGINKSPEYIDERRFFKWLIDYGEKRFKVDREDGK